MSHDAGSCYFCLQTHEHPADAVMRSWEEQECPTEGTPPNPPIWIIPFISLWVTSGKSSLFLFMQWVVILLLISLPLFSFVFVTPSLRAEGFWGMQGPAPGLDQSALQWFLLFGVCVFPEKLLVCCLPLVLFLKHTLIYSECKCACLCTGWQPKSSLNQLIWSPQINHQIWERDTKLKVMVVTMDFLDKGRPGPCELGLKYLVVCLHSFTQLCMDAN